MADVEDEAPQMSEQQMALRKAIFAIMQDTTLSEDEKSQKRQQLLMGGFAKPPVAAANSHDSGAGDGEAGNGFGA